MNNLIKFGSGLSRGLNCNVLGDCGGQTISRRTALGMRRTLGLNVDIKSATDIAHLGMAGAACLLIKPQNKGQKLVGLTILATLVYAYHN